MKANRKLSKPEISQVNVAFKVALKILDRWNCNPLEKQAVLSMGRSTFYKHLEHPEKAKLSPDQVERISYILNIHQALRILFSNPENVYGFMGMPNNNPYFNGKSPIEIIGKGSFAGLYEVFKRIDALRGGQW